jgi:hypothetical protein
MNALALRGAEHVMARSDLMLGLTSSRLTRSLLQPIDTLHLKLSTMNVLLRVECTNMQVSVTLETSSLRQKSRIESRH